MSSSFPESIRTLVTTRKKGGRPRRTPSGAQGDAEVQETALEPSNVDQGVGGVQLEAGQEGSARVQKRGNGWVWEFVSGTKDDLRLQLGEGTLLFPASRQLPSTAKSDQSANIAQSLEYVRTICDKYAHLGMDDLVNAELATEVEGERYDPFLGRKMVSHRNGHAKIARNMVLFAAGELGNHLHAAVLLGDSNKHIKNAKLSRILVNSTTLNRYPTQILQIASSPLPSPYRDDQQATTLIIRQHSSVTMYRINLDPAYNPVRPASPIKLVQMGEVRVKDLGWRRVVDAVVDPVEWGRAALVDESGGVWIWGWKRVSGNMKGESGMMLTKVREKVTIDKNNFFRISFGTRQGTLLIISGSEAVIIDIEDPTYPTRTIFTLDASRTFTAIDTTASSRQSTYTCLVTTREVLWVDETASEGPPALSWKHEFSDGETRDLEITHIPQDESDCFIMSSRSNPSLMVFHVSTHGTLQSLNPPYTLSLPLDARLKPLTDLLIFDRNVELLSEDREADLALLSIASDGSVWGTSLSKESADEESGALKVGWDGGLESRAEDGPILYKKPLAPGMEDKEETRYAVMDTRWAWLAINKAVEIEEDDPIFNAEEFSRYIREVEAPFEHYTTAAEIARDSVLREGEVKRSHILRQLPIPNLDNEEITQLSTLDLQRDFNLVHRSPISPPTIDGHLTETTGPLMDLTSIHDALNTAFPLRADTPATKLRHRRCIDALAVDLAMSNIVLSSEAVPELRRADPLRSGMTDDDVLARAAGLTLTDNGPPPIEFAILPPKHAEEEDEEIISQNPSLANIQNPTVRSLLSEWSLGTAAQGYTWKPWVETEDRSRHGSTLAVPRPIRPLPSSPRPNSPRPPDLDNYFSQPITTNRHAPPVVQSQPLPPSRGSEWSSQPNVPRKKGSMPFLAPTGFETRGSSPIPGETQESGGQGVNTQIERGPFGGRQGGEKKKKVKKRVGGF